METHRLYPRTPAPQPAGGFPSALAEVTERCGLVPASSLASPSDHAEADPQPPPDPKVPGKAKAPAVGISTQVLYEDMLLTVSVQAPLTTANLAALRAKLKRLGLEPLPAPVVWTPEGLPICPRHHVLMTRREMQGDVWYSHAFPVLDADGEPILDGKGKPSYRLDVSRKVIFCRGCGGRSSPGWELP